MKTAAAHRDQGECLLFLITTGGGCFYHLQARAYAQSKSRRTHIDLLPMSASAADCGHTADAAPIVIYLSVLSAQHLPLRDLFYSEVR